MKCIQTQRRNTTTRTTVLGLVFLFGVLFCFSTCRTFFVIRRHDLYGSTSTTNTGYSMAAAIEVDRVLDEEESSSLHSINTDGTTTTTTTYNSSQNSTNTRTNTEQKQDHHNTNKKKRWNWNPEDTHPCNIRRYSAIEWQKTRLVALQRQPQDRRVKSHNKFMDVPLSLTGTTMSSTTTNTKYGIVPSLYHVPIIIQQNRTVNELFRYKTHRHRILQQFHNYTTFRVTLSSSNALSEHRQTVLFHDYLNTSYTLREIYPDEWSNESWYLFGETYTQEWYTTLLQYYILPPCHTCHSIDNVALSFGIGNIGSGVQWHIHGPGFSEAIHGRKHWILHPPNMLHTPPSSDNNDDDDDDDDHTADIVDTKYRYRYRNNYSESSLDSTTTTTAATTNIPIDEYHKDHSSRYWMEYVYPFLPKHIRKQHYYECTLDPGDVIYFPNHWWHATINLDRYTAFISTFTNEHVV